MIGGPRIKHFEDVPENEVVRIEFEDGRSASIWERFIEFSPRYMVFYNRWDPGMMARRHGHHGDHTIWVLEGEVACGDVVCKKGTHVFLMHGDTFGPWIAGPEGCELLGVIAGEGSSFCSDEDMADYLALLAKHGAKQGAVPPLKNIPPWKPKTNILPGPLKEQE
jgi:hypothetical protein